MAGFSVTAVEPLILFHMVTQSSQHHALKLPPILPLPSLMHTILRSGVNNGVTSQRSARPVVAIAALWNPHPMLAEIRNSPIWSGKKNKNKKTKEILINVKVNIVSLIAAVDLGFYQISIVKKKQVINERSFPCY